VVTVIAHTESPVDEVGDALGGPQVGLPAVGAGAAGEQAEQFALLLLGEPGVGSGVALGVEAMGALLVEGGFPAVDRAGAGAGAPGDLGLGEAVGEQALSPSPSALEFLGGSWRSHGRDDAQAIRES